MFYFSLTKLNTGTLHSAHTYCIHTYLDNTLYILGSFNGTHNNNNNNKIHICKPVFAGTTATASHDEHSGRRGRERFCDHSLGGQQPQRPAAFVTAVGGTRRLVRHRPVHRRGPRDRCRCGRCRFERRVRRGARLPSARRTVGLRAAVRRCGLVQQAVHSIVRRREPGVPHPGVLGPTEPRRRDRPDQRPTGKQTEPR